MGGCLENLQLGCAVCKIGTYMVFRRLCCKPPPQPRPEFSVICIGLSKAGKTQLLCNLTRDKEEVVATTGFLIKAVQCNRAILNVKEIGGGEKVRPFWKHYYQGTQGILFVVDSSSSEEDLETATDALTEALANPALRGIPCIILANHQDKEGARSKSQLEEEMGLADICDGRKWAVHGCTASHIQHIAQARDGLDHLISFLLGTDTDVGSGDNDCKKVSDKYNRV